MAHRKRSLVVKSLAAALLIVLALASLAIAAPKILNYQGNLYQDGQPVTATKTMVFRIYAEADDAISEALWESGNVTVTVTNGVFSVTLGASPQTAFPANLFDSDTRFLGIMVDGAEMTERKRLASVPYALSSAIPKGGIIMWSGSVASIPTGWAICDGQNATPDLRDRFIVGAGSGYAVGATGGVATNNLAHSHNVNNHTHGIAAESPGTSGVGDHSHSFNVNTGPPGGADPTASGPEKPNEEKRASETHIHNVAGNTGGGGGHSHTVNSHSHGGATGGSTPGTNNQLSSSVENRPPYYALCFIMKL